MASARHPGPREYASLKHTTEAHLADDVLVDLGPFNQLVQRLPAAHPLRRLSLPRKISSHDLAVRVEDWIHLLEC